MQPITQRALAGAYFAAVLAFGIAFSPAVRAWYLGNGSFGLMNDYARVAFQVLHVPLEAVGIMMGVVSLAVFPIVLALTWNPPAVPHRTRTRGKG